ncbi:hypothetical protein CLV58_12581 [Spirosoma oryzae]|uniref:Terminase n=1 Tax=Spirosoma oryzae TaxID=1469603 RepID=A0A2T0S8R5_9BACT|nr:hypothetical protein [Spirosoma oryzae]PRY29819.1 hypothetical protein CLV58_12581 [Spirosoma oryzae]
MIKPLRFHSDNGGGGLGEIVDFLNHPDSAQVRYRPVLHEEIPEVGEPGDVTSDSARWWSRELLRCTTQGWSAPDGVWFNPIYYFYLNHVRISFVDEQTQLPVEEAPLYNDSDKAVFDEIYWSLAHNLPLGAIPSLPGEEGKRLTRKEKKAENKRRWALYRSLEKTMSGVLKMPATDVIATKGRRKHWSYNILCGVMVWAFCVHINGDLGCGFDSKDSREEGQRVFRGAYDRLHPFWKHPELYTDKEGELSACVYRYDQDGNLEKREGNVIHFKELDKRPGAFRGRIYRIVLFDEAGKYLNLNKVIGATRDCLRVGTFKFGTMLIGGTCDPITNKSDSYQKLWEQAVRKGWNKIFIPACRMAPPNVNWFTGISDEVAARAAYMAERQQFIDAGDMEGYYLTVQENPLDEFELFMLPTLSNYPSHKLLEATVNIAGFGENLPVKRIRLEWELNTFGKKTGTVLTYDDPNGPWLMHVDYSPHKELSDLDVAGIDSVYKDNAPHSESKCAVVLYRREHHRLERSDRPMLVYFDRPLLDIFSDEVKKLMVWTGCRVILEHNDKWLADDILKEKIPSPNGPVLLGEQLMYYNEEPGLRNSDTTILTQTKLALKWINDGGLMRVVFQSIVDALKNWRQKNDDIASALHLCLMGVDTLRETTVDGEVEAQTAPQPYQFGNNTIGTVAVMSGGMGLMEAMNWNGEGLAPFGMDNPAWNNPFASRNRMAA